MKDRVRDLFYSKNEKIVFWVVGYTQADNSSYVTDIISSLTHHKKEFLTLIGEGENLSVRTTQITKSRRYKYTRVFWASLDRVPDGAFVIDDSQRFNDPTPWTMWKWLED